MKKFAILLSSLLCLAAFTRAAIQSVPLIPAGWHQLQLGGGGRETNSDFPVTGVRFVNTDAGGAFLWNTITNKWQQIVCQVCIPVNSTPGAYNFGLFPSTGGSQVLGGPAPSANNAGVLGLVGAPSDATVAYMFIDGHVLVSTSVDPTNPNNIGWVDTSPIYSSSITNATWSSASGGLATFTVTRLQNLCAVGCFFTVTGLNPSGFNGSYIATSVVGNNITAALVSNPGTFVSGGTYHSITADFGVSNSRSMRAIEVDPNNKDHVIVSTQYDGIFETFNGTAGGSATWAPLSASVPVQYNTGTNGANQIALIAFDPNSGTTGGLTNTVYVATPGTPAGVYQTTSTTTGTWSLLAGSPASAQSLKVTTATVGQGDLWLEDSINAVGRIFQFTGGTWADLAVSSTGSVSTASWSGGVVSFTIPTITTTVGLHVNDIVKVTGVTPSGYNGTYTLTSVNGTTHVFTANLASDPGPYSSSGTFQYPITCCNGGISVNPFNGNQVIAATPKQLYVSTNGGTTFTPFLAGLTATDAPWQTWMSSRTSLTVGSVNFDPIINGQIWYMAGQGAWFTPSLPAANFNWTSIIAGIETLEAGSGLAIYSAYHPVFGAQDEAGCQFNVLTNATAPPSSCIPLAASKALSYFHNLYVPPTDPTFMVGKANQNFGKPEYSGYSTDGFNQSYLPFNTWNTTVSTSPSNPFTNVGGNIKVTVADTTGLTTWAPGNAGNANSILCAYATAVTRNPTQAEFALNSNNFSCYSITVNDSTHFTLNHSTFANLGNPLAPSYVFFAPSTTLFSDWKGTFRIISVVDDGTGKVKVNLDPAAGTEISALDPVCITNTAMAGATVVNGCWIAASATSAAVVLQDSTFAGGDSIVTAGTMTSWDLPGGSIAATTKNNIAIIPADNGTLQCSVDGGKTWVLNQPVPFTQTTVTGGPYLAGSTSINLASTSGYTSGGSFTLYMDDGNAIWLTQTGAPSGSTINFTTPLPAGTSVSAGNALWSNNIGSGYGFAAFGNLQMLAADYVTPNTFYAVNTNSGLYRWTNCGTPVLVNANVGSWLTLAGVNSQLKTVPGESGHLFFSAGASGSSGAPHPATDGLWRSCSASTGSVTMERVSGFFEVKAFGFGLAKPGNSYSSEWVSGWYDPGNVRANAIWGTWVSRDDPNHGAAGPCNVAANAQTWTQIGGYPTGWNYTFNSLSGDPYVYGMVYGGTVSGWYYGYFP